jgi:hypothetical protein
MQVSRIVLPCKTSHSSEYRSASPLGHFAPGGNVDSFLRLDSQLPQRNYERSQRAQANRQSAYVPQPLVVHANLHRHHIRLLLLQFIHLCRSFQREFRARALAHTLVYPRRLAQRRIPRRRHLHRVYLAANRKQQEVRYERRVSAG